MRATTDKTARKDARTAGKTATKSTPRIWRTATRNGVTRIIAPDGTQFYGTVKEVREAALMPHRRKHLAELLRMARILFRSGTLNSQEYKNACESYRRETICYGATDSKIPHFLNVSAEMLIRFQAMVRLVGDKTPDDYLALLLQREIDAQTCKRAIVFTRHEQDALAAIAADK